MPRSTPPPKGPKVGPVLGAAVDRAMKSNPDIGKQEVLAAVIGVNQTTVSKWITGTITTPLDRVTQIESVCGLPRGQVLVWAGLVAEDVIWDQPGGKVVALPLERRRPAAAAAERGEADTNETGTVRKPPATSGFDPDDDR